jgi:excisionase family DNA binding protein
MGDRHVIPHRSEREPASVVTVVGDSTTADATATPDEPPIRSPLLTTRQAATYLQVTERTVKNLISEGDLAIVKIGRATRIRSDDLDDFITRNRRTRRHPTSRAG